MEVVALENKQALQREARRRMMLEDPMMKVIPRVAVPMIILYELSILISAAVYKKRQRKEAQDEDDDE